jgi:hypothetical protein
VGAAADVYTYTSDLSELSDYFCYLVGEFLRPVFLWYVAPADFTYINKF